MFKYDLIIFKYHFSAVVNIVVWYYSPNTSYKVTLTHPQRMQKTFRTSLFFYLVWIPCRCLAYVAPKQHWTCRVDRKRLTPLCQFYNTNKVSHRKACIPSDWKTLQSFLLFIAWSNNELKIQMCVCIMSFNGVHMRSSLIKLLTLSSCSVFFTAKKCFTKIVSFKQLKILNIK